jgi:hypothetical protein
MKHSSDSHESNEGPQSSLDLKLPPGEKFRSLPPLVSIEEMMRRSRQLREWFPAGLPTEQERWRAKSEVEFKL